MDDLASLAFDSGGESGYSFDYDPGNWANDVLDPGLFQDPGMSFPETQQQPVMGGRQSEGLLGLLSGPLGKSLASTASGIFGLFQSNQLQGMAKTAFDRADPFGGQRGQYAKQLQGLMANPGSIVNDPGYKFSFDQGTQAVDRKMASAGYRGSGNEAIALQEYGQGFANNYLHEQEQFLAGLAGAQMPANYGPAMSGYTTGTDIAGQSLASLGYGMTRAGGASAGTPAAGGFSSAGGEAAKILGVAGDAMGLYGAAAKQFGWETPDALKSLGGYLGNANAALGIASGLERGGVEGYGRAALGAERLASKGGFTSAGMDKFASGAASALGVYSGIKEGGVAGYGQAAASGVQLASKAGLVSSGAGKLAGQFGGYLTAANVLFGKMGKKEGAIEGAQAGYQIGGPWGALIGGVAGYALHGGADDLNPIKASGFTGTGMDQAWKDDNLARLGSNPGAAVASKLGAGENTVLGQLLDPTAIFGSKESQSHHTWESWKKYEGQGNALDLDPYHMAEIFKGAWESNQKGFGGGHFAHGKAGRDDYLKQMTGQINEALKSGKITSAMTPQQINDLVIMPWMKGYGGTDPDWVKGVNTDLIQQYMAGRPLYGNTTLKSDPFQLNQQMATAAHAPPAALPSSGASNVVQFPDRLSSGRMTGGPSQSALRAVGS